VTTSAWRSSALNAPPEDRSIQLLRVQNSAIEALTRLDRHQEAEVWFGRAKTLQSRANSSPEENARFTINVVRLMQWRTPNRKAQPRTYLTEIARGALSGDPKGRRIRNTAREMLARIAIKDGSYFEAQGAIAEIENDPPMPGVIPEMERRVAALRLRCEISAVEGHNEAQEQAQQDIESVLRKATEDAPDIRDLPITTGIRSQ